MKNYTFFWRSNSYLSQWNMSTPFVGMDGLKYNCAEQYMMAQKARLFGDYDMADLIMAAKSPKEQKKLGREVQDYDDDIWREASENIVFTGNFYKFTQNPAAFKELILSDCDIVEASPYDAVWGIGFDEEHALQVDPDDWGQNKLGKILTKLRNGLRQNCKQY